MTRKPDRELIAFLLLTPAEQADAIRRMAAQRMSDTTIAAATRLSVEQVQHILASPPSEPER